MSLVLDSSIVGCWCFPDEANPIADLALEQVGAGTAIAPVLWWFVVRNVLAVNERRGRIDPPGSAASLADLARSPDGGLGARSCYISSCTLPLELAQLGPVSAPEGGTGNAVAAPCALPCRRAARGLPTGRAGSPVRAAHRPDRGGFRPLHRGITDQTGRVRLPTGEIVPKVPFSVFWLVECDAFIGETSIRHQLNAHLLKEGATSATASDPHASARATAS
jgi:hypothetical protein